GEGTVGGGPAGSTGRAGGDPARGGGDRRADCRGRGAAGVRRVRATAGPAADLRHGREHDSGGGPVPGGGRGAGGGVARGAGNLRRPGGGGDLLGGQRGAQG